MDADIGQILTVWTVRASVACWAVAVWRYFFRSPATPKLPHDASVSERSPDRIYAYFWAAAWLLCVVHALCAFHFFHHWSHAAALNHTTMQTERVTGLAWGGGLYVNWVFVAVWGLSVADTFSALHNVQNRVRFGMAIHLVTACMMFSATAVFGPGWWWIPVIGFSCAIVWTKMESAAC